MHYCMCDASRAPDSTYYDVMDRSRFFLCLIRVVDSMPWNFNSVWEKDSQDTSGNAIRVRYLLSNVNIAGTMSRDMLRGPGNIT